MCWHRSGWLKHRHDITTEIRQGLGTATHQRRSDGRVPVQRCMCSSHMVENTCILQRLNSTIWDLSPSKAMVFLTDNINWCRSSFSHANRSKHVRKCKHYYCTKIVTLEEAKLLLKERQYPKRHNMQRQQYCRPSKLNTFCIFSLSKNNYDNDDIIAIFVVINVFVMRAICRTYNPTSFS